jgi:hypothetical protein
MHVFCLSTSALREVCDLPTSTLGRSAEAAICSENATTFSCHKWSHVNVGLSQLPTSTGCLTVLIFAKKKYLSFVRDGAIFDGIHQSFLPMIWVKYNR